MSNVAESKQPTGRVPGNPNYRAGALRSVNRLKALGFDPIGVLVDRYKALLKDVEHYRTLQSGKIVELQANGRPRVFNYDTLVSMETQLATIADKLLRYGYGRVPENAEDEKPPMAPMIVQLTRKGDVFVINDDSANFEDVNELPDL